MRNSDDAAMPSASIQNSIHRAPGGSMTRNTENSRVSGASCCHASSDEERCSGRVKNFLCAVCLLVFDITTCQQNLALRQGGSVRAAEGIHVPQRAQTGFQAPLCHSNACG